VIPAGSSGHGSSTLLGKIADLQAEISPNHAVQISRTTCHFELIIARVGEPGTKPYTSDGVRPSDTCYLSQVSRNQLNLQKVALGKQNEAVKFSLPRNADNVSYAIFNFQNAYSVRTPFIEVEAVTRSSLMDRVGISPSHIAHMKFDIEVAEIEVLEDALRTRLLPRGAAGALAWAG